MLHGGEEEAGRAWRCGGARKRRFALGTAEGVRRGGWRSDVWCSDGEEDGSGLRYGSARKRRIERKSVVEGKRGLDWVELGGRRDMKESRMQFWGERAKAADCGSLVAGTGGGEWLAGDSL